MQSEEIQSNHLVCVLPYPFHQFKTVEKADILFGKIHQIYQHYFKDEMHDWVDITVFDNTQLNYPYWTTSKNKDFQYLYLSSIYK